MSPALLQICSGVEDGELKMDHDEVDPKTMNSILTTIAGRKHQVQAVDAESLAVFAESMFGSGEVDDLYKFIAERRYFGQPASSEHLSKLEYQLGVKIIMREVFEKDMLADVLPGKTRAPFHTGCNWVVDLDEEPAPASFEEIEGEGFAVELKEHLANCISKPTASGKRKSFGAKAPRRSTPSAKSAAKPKTGRRRGRPAKLKVDDEATVEDEEEKKKVEKEEEEEEEEEQVEEQEEEEEEQEEEEEPVKKDEQVEEPAKKKQRSTRGTVKGVEEEEEDN